MNPLDQHNGAHSSSPPYFASFAKHVNAPYVGFLRGLGLDVEIVKAQGVTVTDAQGRRWIDTVAGYGNLNLGHNHPKIISALTHTLQAGLPFNWPFISRLYTELANDLAGLTGGELDCCLLTNSGSEAIESALKLARLATGKSGVLCAEGAWHGFTLGALSVSEPSMRPGLGELDGHIRRVPYGDISALRDSLSSGIGCVLLEPIQAESGAVVSPPGYLGEVAELCKSHGVLLVLDEVKIGLGKTGKMLASQHESVVPDALVLGKSLGGGVMPIGAILARRRWWVKCGLSFAMFSSSSGGNTFAAAAARATLQVVRDERLPESAARQGAHLVQQLGRIVTRHDQVATGWSGRGLLLALHTRSASLAVKVVQKCIRQGVICLPAFGNRSRILIEPPLIIDNAQIQRVAHVLEQAIAEVAAETRA